MMRSVQSLTGYSILASDGEIGKCMTCTLMIRPGRSVGHHLAELGSHDIRLSSALVLTKTQWKEMGIETLLSREQVEKILI